ncbi:RND transporter [Mesoterricola silvestris]|uniref:RND transporter n=2 Tax=Mesoterricola silvestris TaxID=2927979 RepID=A0AA48KAG7_9BACT|nr:efflux RND transporter permease subunit [Mesoterricola silvestris]BDU71498.1 RND transporter [Mesoterricola silvestris]
MWIVRLALRRPYTTAIFSLLILLMGGLSVVRMPVDILPTIDIPVVSVVWTYNGLSAEEMERRVIRNAENVYSTTVGGIEHIDSTSLQSVGLLRVYFHPGTDIGAAIAQITASNSAVMRFLPPGMTPPLVLQFNASNVPIVQVTAKSATVSEQKLWDLAMNTLRIRLFTIPGLAIPAPYGGKTRQINIDVDPVRLSAQGLSPADVVNALNSMNVITPAGTVRMGNREWVVKTNGSASTLEELEAIPVKVVGGASVLLRDIAKVTDGFADQTNIVRIDGQRATYIALMKKADASTIAVVDAARAMMPQIQAAAPSGVELKLDFDQSLFVRNAVRGVVQEAFIATILVSIMILLFLGSWRSVIIVCTSIPLAILTGVVGLKLTGQTLNLMTLGGFSLAIGMLVDDATVEVENIHRNRAMGKPITVAILDGAYQIAIPAIVATLAICIVFFPVVLLVGPAKYLFTPLALAVVLSMLASYVLSRTLVPTLARMLMPGEPHFPSRFNVRREELFFQFQEAFGRSLDGVLHHRRFVLVAFAGFTLLSGGLFFALGQDFFPAVDAGQMKLHLRTPPGTRLEEAERIIIQVEKVIRDIIPAKEMRTLNANIGAPAFFIQAFIPSDNVTSQDADLFISLQEHHHPTATYMKRIREEIPKRFPGLGLYFQPADIVSQVLNFGVSAPIDLKVEGQNLDVSMGVARKLEAGLKRIPGAVDIRIKQVLDAPTYQVDVDRTKAARLGLSSRDVTNGLLVSLSGNGQLAPNFFLDPRNGITYQVMVKSPIPAIDSPGKLLATPFALPGKAALLQAADARPNPMGSLQPAEPLGNFASLSRTVTPAEVSHATVQRVLDVMANVDGRDLGSVVKDIRAQVQALGELPPGVKITLKGQNEVMENSFRSLAGGLVIAIILVYMLMVVLYQSWLDPFIILFAVPGALVGILWMLVLTGTTVNVVSLMGAIMAVGIAVSNAILLVTFANDLRVARPDLNAVQAALEAGRTRLRPVIMTALAMIIGMVPMALGLGEAGSQNAPLGRAVIGGLLMATFVTLFVVPVIYSLLRKQSPTAHLLETQFQQDQQGSQA